jgi:hypothetical protein
VSAGTLGPNYILVQSGPPLVQSWSSLRRVYKYVCLLVFVVVSSLVQPKFALLPYESKVCRIVAVWEKLKTRVPGWTGWTRTNFQG